GDPGEQVDVVQFKQRLVFVQLGVGQRIDGSVGEMTENQVHFARAAVPGSEKKLAPTRVQPLSRSCRAHDEPFPVCRAAHIAWMTRPVSLAHGRGAHKLAAMRPSLLDPLFVPITSLAGVGPKIANLIAKVVPADISDRPARAGDLIFTLPNSVIDRRNRPGIALAPGGAIVTLDVTVDRHQPAPPGNRSVPYRVYAFDDTGEIALTFFHANTAWLERSLPVGEEVTVSGRMEWFNGRPSMVHPDYIARAADAGGLPLVEPVYPLTAGLSGKVLRRAIGQALERVPELPEWQDAEVMRRQTFPPLCEALSRIHNPADPIDVSPDSAAWRRLAYDEFLAGQISLALVRATVRKLSGRPLTGDGKLIAAIKRALPYELTGSQTQALAEIDADLQKPERMLRLLQGDVGSGKTVVALLAMARAVEAGGQA